MQTVWTSIERKNNDEIVEDIGEKLKSKSMNK